MFRPSSSERSHMLMGLSLPGLLCGTLRCFLTTELSCASSSELGMGAVADAAVQAVCQSVSWQRNKLCLDTWGLSS